MNNIDKVYKLIEELKNPYNDYGKGELANYLLEALGELGYTVPDLPYEGIFSCGLCDAKAKEIKRLKSSNGAV